MYSYTEENYLKAILFLTAGTEKGASTNAIADRLETKAASVTDMLKRLSEKELLQYRKYQGVKLTAKGKDVATRTLRKHRLWEVFLVEQLGFGWDEVHDIAEQLEHIQSKELTDRLDAFLGHPQFDPHGDPIPDKDGKFPKRSELTLSECEPGSVAIVKGVKDTSTDFLRYLEKQEIGLGSELEITEKESFDLSMKVKPKGKAEIQLSEIVSSNLYVKLK